MPLFKIVFDLLGNNSGTDATVIMPFHNENAAWDWARGNWRIFGGPGSRVKSVMNVTAPQKGEQI